ncbi:MAG: type II toxin-antitoxin system HicA family toxin [Calditrichaceae bacterium]|nr:type II toxin-antitoxin system HicA family toxin [Calditrichaceae bacterium]MBN2709647.1 type II toxin-antitoxin system HicA family toxin [Calditrichaceae bacterium]RQV92442.1 MAG: type II toxin-antitoxin system HicA family toxin [Calditrichota bacterium]
MRRSLLIKHVEKNGCRLLREGSKHSLYVNDINKKITTIPRHNEIKDFLAKKICKDLDIGYP